MVTLSDLSGYPNTLKWTLRTQKKAVVPNFYAIRVSTENWYSRGFLGCRIEWSHFQVYVVILEPLNGIFELLIIGRGT
jgi:hypothetical protein